MTNPPDELMDRLERVDPVSSDPCPAAGSNRFTSIKDIAMSMNDLQLDNGTNPEPSAEPAPRFTGRTRLLLGAAAAVVALGVVVVALVPGSTSTAAAAVREAVANSAEVTDFRMTMVADDVAVVPGGRADGEVDGDNLYLQSGDLEFYRVGDREWIGEGGRFQSMPATETFLPFGQASKAVLTAALASGDVTEQGQEILNGVQTIRYAIGIDASAADALSAVPSDAQFWFVGNVSEEIIEDGSSAEPRRFGFLEDATSIDVWVADGLIHQIAVDSGSSHFTYTFHDFDADITITPPR